MDDPGDAPDEPDDDSAAGQGTLADAADSAGDDVEGEPGLPPAGDDPMDGAAPSG
ncbi:MAG TPA: hypothetical protein VK507_24825 [Iamia sp.]|nr:hypothetical protein [Iamia sp.]